MKNDKIIMNRNDKLMMKITDRGKWDKSKT